MKTKSVLFFAAMALLPLVSFAQKDSAGHLTLGLETGTVTASDNNNSPYWAYYSNPYYYAYFGNAGTAHNKSFSVGIRAVFQLKNKLSLRLRGGLIDYNSEFDYNSADYVPNQNPNQTETYTLTTKAKDIYLSLGLQQNFTISKVITLYGGADFRFVIAGVLKNEANDVTSDGTYTDTQDNLQSIPGGIKASLGPVVGVVFNLGKSFSIGTELTDGLQYQHVGGTVDETDKSTSASAYGTSSNSSAIQYKLITEGFSSTGAIATITFMFKF